MHHTSATPAAALLLFKAILAGRASALRKAVCQLCRPGEQPRGRASIPSPAEKSAAGVGRSARGFAVQTCSVLAGQLQPGTGFSLGFVILGEAMCCPKKWLLPLTGDPEGLRSGHLGRSEIQARTPTPRIAEMRSEDFASAQETSPFVLHP